MLPGQLLPTERAPGPTGRLLQRESPRECRSAVDYTNARSANWWGCHPERSLRDAPISKAPCYPMRRQWRLAARGAKDQCRWTTHPPVVCLSFRWHLTWAISDLPGCPNGVASIGRCPPSRGGPTALQAKPLSQRPMPLSFLRLERTQGRRKSSIQGHSSPGGDSAPSISLLL